VFEVENRNSGRRSLVDQLVERVLVAGAEIERSLTFFETISN